MKIKAPKPHVDANKKKIKDFKGLEFDETKETFRRVKITNTSNVDCGLPNSENFKKFTVKKGKSNGHKF